MASAFTIQRSNQTKTLFIITTFTLLTVGFFYVLGRFFNNPIFTAIGLILGIGQPLLGYFYGDKMALGLARAKEIAYETNPQLHEMVENLARIAGVPKPKIFLSPDPSPNAFATGRNPSRASIAFNQGILDLLSKQELEGVAAHELSHIKNRDTLIMTVAAILASVIGFLADWGGRMAFFGGGSDDSQDRGWGGTALFFVAIFLTPFISFLLQMSISRSREYVADATAVTYTRNADGLKNALLKLHKNPTPSTTAHSFTNHMYISEPRMNWGEKVSGLFSTHPPVAQRVKNLEEMGGQKS